MKVWALVRANQKIVRDVVVEFPGSRPDTIDDWQPILGELCQKLHESRPVMLNKHLHQLLRFSRTEFLPSDFMETIDFEKLELMIFPEKNAGPDMPIPYRIKHSAPIRIRFRMGALCLRQRIQRYPF